MIRKFHMMGLTLTATLLVAVALPLATAKKLQTDPATPPANAPAPTTEVVPAALSITPLRVADRNFFNHAVLASNYEIAAAELALTMSSSPEIRTFAQIMINDHSDMRIQVLATMNSINPEFEIPVGTSNLHALWLERLQNAGANFDSEYKRQMQLSHQDTLEKLQRYVSNGNANPELLEEATKALPVVEAHLAAANVLLE